MIIKERFSCFRGSRLTLQKDNRKVVVQTIEETNAGGIIMTGHMEIILTPPHIVRRIYALAKAIHKGSILEFLSKIYCYCDFILMLCFYVN